MVIDIQQTAFVVLCVAYVVNYFYDNIAISKLHLRIWGVSFFGSIIVILATTLIRIWS